jgi:uncharacterized protein with PIN domain
MLGKLARWLRLIGQDSKYSTKLDDQELLLVAKTENSILLTKDLALHQKAMSEGIETYYVVGNREPERLAELAYRFNIKLSIDLKKSRCPKCNTKLVPVPKQEIRNKVEKNTYKYYDEFWLCPNCGHAYWQGGHWIKIRNTLREAKEKLKNKVEI